MDAASPSLYDQVCANPILGRGRYGGVFRCENETHGSVAIKVSKRRSLQEMSVPNEVFALTTLPPHPNVVRFITWMQDDEWVYLMTEIVGRGTTLLDLLVGRVCEWSHLPDAMPPSLSPMEYTGFSELNAWLLFWQLAGAVGHCHLHHIAHRDIKPENVLVRPRAGVPADRPLGHQVELVLCDFGFATTITPGVHKSTCPGSFSFAAPELILGIPYEASRPDMWALGVLLYVMLTCRFPFGRLDTSTNRQRIVQATPMMDTAEAPVPIRARSLLQRLFSVPPALRGSVPEMMEHNWMAQEPLLTQEGASNHG